MASAFICLLLFVAVFVVVQRDLVDRGAAMLIGAGAFLLLGWALDFYTPARAVQAVYFDTLALLFGMSLISHLLFKSGIFHELAFEVVTYSRGNALLVLVLLVLVTYTISLVFNNLSVMVVMVPLTLVLCRSLAMDPGPVVAAELIASNLGGASTLVGDFPNMIIGAAARLHFDDFIAGMMVPCLILLAVLLLYFQRRLVAGAPGGVDLESARRALAALSPVRNRDGRGGVDPYLFRVGASVLGVTLAGFFLAQSLGLNPSTVAFWAGIAILIFGRVPRAEWFQAMSGGDILFFLGLFVMVGGLQESGLLDGLHGLIAALGAGSATLSLLLLMWIAGLVTPFLNAGPATAFLIPVAKSLSVDFPGATVWWALSLGVLAGSSATLSGATAGPVVASGMVNFRDRFSGGEAGVLDFRRYLRWGLPMAGLFLGISSLYIMAITP
ncbi:MAG: sodium:proton antiporter [Magnetococcales bacterium]|nr:sodium:proton antiporter [Magnetococcales bacterium]